MDVATEQTTKSHVLVGNEASKMVVDCQSHRKTLQSIVNKKTHGLKCHLSLFALHIRECNTVCPYSISCIRLNIQHLRLNIGL